MRCYDEVRQKECDCTMLSDKQGLHTITYSQHETARVRMAPYCVRTPGPSTTLNWAVYKSWKPRFARGDKVTHWGRPGTVLEVLTLEGDDGYEHRYVVRLPGQVSHGIVQGELEHA